MKNIENGFKVVINGVEYIYDANKISLNFKNKKIKVFHMGEYFIITSGDDYLFTSPSIRNNYPSKDFIKAVESGEFKCSFTTLDNIGYVCR